MVGAVVVSPDGVVVGQGWHERAGEAHAEVHALTEAGDRARNGTLYVTLEPCCHFGRTGPCTRRVIEAGIVRVVTAMRDPDPRVNGRGAAELRAHGIVVDEGVCQAAAARLNRGFVSIMTRARPWVLAKSATSLDGRVAARPGARTTLSSRASHRLTHAIRASVDAIAVGSETLIVDDPLLNARECRRVRPLVRVVFDRRLRTPPTSRVFATLDDGPVVIVTSRAGGAEPGVARLESVGATVVRTESLAESLRALVAFDVCSILVEGGPMLHTSLWREGLVDSVCVIVTPHVLGPDGVKWMDVDTAPRSSWSQVAAEPRGADIWIEADVHGHC
jgi:diaminohydroxyphosphoribosylaminopyrimidine deaminase/5-amino-6-(5-phosphoribosylamino)uracil reductase